MRHRSRPVAALSLALAGFGLLAGAAAPWLQPQPTPQAGSVIVTVTDLRNAKGVVRACLTDEAGNFPKCNGEKHVRRAVAAAATEITLRFENIRPGRYAIALIHDENDNDRMDRAMLMMPKEGYGFSRDAKVVLGPPKFSAAAFEVGSAPVHQTIRMRYMF